MHTQHFNSCTNLPSVSKNEENVQKNAVRKKAHSFNFLHAQAEFEKFKEYVMSKVEIQEHYLQGMRDGFMRIIDIVNKDPLVCNIQEYLQERTGFFTEALLVVIDLIEKCKDLISNTMLTKVLLGDKEQVKSLCTQLYFFFPSIADNLNQRFNSIKSPIKNKIRIIENFFKMDDKHLPMRLSHLWAEVYFDEFFLNELKILSEYEREFAKNRYLDFCLGNYPTTELGPLLLELSNTDVRKNFVSEFGNAIFIVDDITVKNSIINILTQNRNQLIDARKAGGLKKDAQKELIDKIRIHVHLIKNNDFVIQQPIPHLNDLNKDNYFDNSSEDRGLKNNESSDDSVNTSLRKKLPVKSKFSGTTIIFRQLDISDIKDNDTEVKNSMGHIEVIESATSAKRKDKFTAFIGQKQHMKKEEEQHSFAYEALMEGGLCKIF